MPDENERRIKQLERALEQSKAREEQAKAREEQAKAREEHERHEKERERREKERERREKEQAQEQLKHHSQKTTLEEFLRDSHLYVFKALRIASESISSTGHATKVDGKYYPLWLRCWENFTTIQRDHFDKISSIFGESKLFLKSSSTKDISTRACRGPAAYEDDIEHFEKDAIEAPVLDIFDCLKHNSGIREEFNFASLEFSKNHRRVKQQSDIDQAGRDKAASDEEASDRVQERPRQTGSNKRLETERKPDTRSTYPDGRGIRICPGGERTAFVYDYKAAHKLALENLKPALMKETLFMEVVDRVCGNKMSSDLGQRKLDSADAQIAMVLTQAFDYMVTNGVKYGYVTGGKSLVFLCTEFEDLRTLYYYLCIPDEQADDDEAQDKNQGVNVFHTAVAQLASFCLLALRSDALDERSVDNAIGNSKLKKWPDPYSEDVDSSTQSGASSNETGGSLFKDKSKKGPPATRNISLRSRSTCKDTAPLQKKSDHDDDEERDSAAFRAPRLTGTTGTKRRKDELSSGNSNDNTSTQPLPSKQYCTQSCLLGLKKGFDLDQNCPNVLSHCTVENGTKHPIDATEFVSLVSEQLCQSPYRYCAAVDPFGLSGKIGAIGALFKLELSKYGYTFVGKGTQSAHLSHLYHEDLVYSRLARLQGEVVPVYLGIVDLTKGYLLPGGDRAFHMMLMSWGGEVASKAHMASTPDMAAEINRSAREVWSEGVYQGDEHMSNVLWNEERRRVMLIDFDHATLLPAAKHKQTLKLSKKRQGRGDSSNL